MLVNVKLDIMGMTGLHIKVTELIRVFPKLHEVGNEGLHRIVT